MAVRRVAMLAVHTSPLEQPGVGDAGGMNVYVDELARELADQGVEVDVFTRATSADQPPVVELAPGVLVRHVVAGPYAGLTKLDLAGELCGFAAEVMRVEAARGPRYYDAAHAHYWLAGEAGRMVRERWGVPLVASMHTLGKVKNATLARGDDPEPLLRLDGEAQVVRSADRLVANTAAEARELVELYGADPARVATVHPGVDLARFAPGDQAAARAHLGLRGDATVLLFVGRLQPLKAPDVLLRTAAELVRRDPTRRDRLVVAVVGGPSGSGAGEPERLRRLAAALGIDDLVVFADATERGRLADWYRAADVTVVPSRSESFGLVALEAQAAGTPVVAAAVGGLRTAVADGRSGLLVPAGHDAAVGSGGAAEQAVREAAAYADAVERVLADPATTARFGRAARAHAETFGWRESAEQLREVYAAAGRSLAVDLAARRARAAAAPRLPDGPLRSAPPSHRGRERVLAGAR